MKMLIGLTGKTGSGKSSASKIFEKLGAFVADCDEIAHLILKDKEVKEKVKKAFPNGIFDDNGEVNRKKLGAIVFADGEKLSLLNKIMHKAIVDKAILMCENSGKDICVLDGSEIESSGAYKKCAHVIVITADEDVRLERIMKRDGIDRENALMRMHSQKDYSKAAVYVNNNGTPELLEKEINGLYDRFYGEINVKTCK